MTHFNEIMNLVSDYGKARDERNLVESNEIYKKICDAVLKIDMNQKENN